MNFWKIATFPFKLGCGIVIFIVGLLFLLVIAGGVFDAFTGNGADLSNGGE